MSRKYPWQFSGEGEGSTFVKKADWGKVTNTSDPTQYRCDICKEWKSSPEIRDAILCDTCSEGLANVMEIDYGDIWDLERF